ncbi:MAG TPA: glutamate-5-semialdehyde dehydrogenase [Bacteroidales bacterium]|jgi:glutamate-5-semialdehyde dehydrogenase|nr:glutamate-5-semialdehyde dehydrogenase [Bacteroidales bacterium]HBZ21271.1 glutamate-5-semialdehyde dehydrogenase [Bacteroidales bacterium]
MNLTSAFIKASEAGRSLHVTDPAVFTDALLLIASETEKRSGVIISENEKDLALMDKWDPNYDRLLLNPERISGIVSDIRNVARMASPLGRILSDTIRPNGLKISRISVPFGVVGVIYESRPNVTFDVFSLCLKSGNACILKGGSEAINSNKEIVGIIKSCLEKLKINPDIITLLPAGRNETNQLLNARSYVDLIIPRGSRELIEFVRKNSTIPVIETGAGICHTYFDEFGDKLKGRDIINNAKTRRVSVCNALDCLIIHKKRLGDLAFLVDLCSGSNVEIYADKEAFCALKGKYPLKLLHKSTKGSFGTEFLSYRMAVKTVESFNDALKHIEVYGSRHSEAIISENDERINLFLTLVDASSVYSNASTAFTDGSEFGLGAEIGISTQKLHARGPMALEEMTTYKWLIKGNGQIRK